LNLNINMVQRNKENKLTVKPLSIIAFVSDVWEHVCPTVRVTSPARFAGVNLIKGNHFLGDDIKVDLDMISQADIVLIQRDFPSQVEQYNAVVEAAKLQNKIIVYELDDLLLELPEQHPDFYHYLTARSSILKAIVDADAVIGSTSAICKYLNTYNLNIYQFNNYLDDLIWDFPKPKNADREKITIGYMGGHSHSYDIESIIAPLESVLTKFNEKLVLRFWGLAPPEPIDSYGNTEWDQPGLVVYKEFAEYFIEQYCDIFIAPLADNLFNRCKSAIKYLEYSSLGIPGIYSRITPYETVVEHGVNGFLASSEDDWNKYLTLLIKDQELRAQIGNSARNNVQKNWLLSAHADEWVGIFNHIMAKEKFKKGSSKKAVMIDKLLEWQNDLEVRSQELNAKLKSTITQLNDQEAILEDTNQRIVVLNRQIDTFQNKLKQSADYQNALKEENNEKDLTIASLTNQVKHSHDVYIEITTSRSWRLIQKLQRMRLALLPRGSKLERILKAGVRAPQILRQEGLKSFLNTGTKKFSQILTDADQTKTIQNQIAFTVSINIQTKDLCQTPAITVLTIKDEKTSTYLEIAVNNWIQNQTCKHTIQSLIWQPQNSIAYFSESPNDTWDALDFNSLMQNLDAPYICLASDDLVTHTSAYLETNLIALESEKLAFTVNLRGSADWGIQQIQRGRLPGNQQHPLLRQVVRKEYLDQEMSLDLSPLISKSYKFPFAAGKVIFHPTNDHDSENSIPFQKIFSGIDWHLLENRIILKDVGSQDWGNLTLNLSRIDEILHPEPVESEIPTSIMVHPYLAIGGAEQIHLKVMENLKGKIQFVIVTFEKFDYAMGTTADAYRKITPYVYTLPDFLDPGLYFSFMMYLINRFEPQTLYIANGTPWIYDALWNIKHRYPHLWIANQVYDSVIGWIHRYDLSLVMNIDSHIGVNSKIIQAYIQEGAKPEQTFLIENGIEPDELNPAEYNNDRILALKRNFNLPENKKIITFASRIHPQKRPMDFVELARRFSRDQYIHFLMVGDGPLAGEVNRQINKIGLSNITRVPFYRPISDILAFSSVVVLPSDFEGMPMVIIEAQAMGVPVVVTDVGNNREVLQRTGGGEVISRIGDVAELMEGVRKMLDNPPNRDILRQKTLSHFDIALIADKYYEALIPS